MPPPPLIALVVVGAGAYVGFRWIARNGPRLGRSLKQAANEVKRSAQARATGGTSSIKDLGDLTRDPDTGAYSPDGTAGDKT